MSLIPAEVLWSAGMANVVYGDRRGLCLQQWPTRDAYVLHGRRRGARRVRRYLRRHAQRNRAQAFAQGWTYRTPTREQRRRHLQPHEVPERHFIAPLFCALPSYVVRLTGVV